MDNDRPSWDQRLAEELEGATILVGITYEEPDNRRQEQFFGTVMSADASEGICLRLGGSRSGEIYYLPPDLRGLFQAQPGSYRLHTTGEILENPDYTSTWTIRSDAN